MGKLAIILFMSVCLNLQAQVSTFADISTEILINWINWELMIR